MESFKRISKVKHKQKKRVLGYKGKRRTFKRTSRPISSLDRLYSDRQVLISRLLRPTNAKNKNSYFARSTLHYAGSLGRATLRRKAVLIRAPLLFAQQLRKNMEPLVADKAFRRAPYTAGQKYRLKTSFRGPAGNHFFGLTTPTLHLRRKTLAYFVLSARRRSFRRRSLAHTQLTLLRQTASFVGLVTRRQLRKRLKTGSQLRRNYKRHKRQKTFVKVLQKRAAVQHKNRLQTCKIAGLLPSRVVGKQLTAIRALSFRRVRSQRRGIQLRYFRR